MKTIWIINYYALPPEYDNWRRHIEFAKRFIKEGYKVRVFGSGYIYNTDINVVPKGKKYLDTEYEGVPYTMIDVPSYHSNGFKRMLSIFLFAFRILLMKNNWETPDIIYHNEHAPFDYPIVILSKKLRTRYIVEAWDLWPDEFVRYGFIGAKNPLTKVAYWLEKKMYDASTDIIYTFEGGIDYLRSMNWTSESKNGKINPEKVHYINNGIILSEFYENVNKYRSNDTDVNDDSKFKVIYLGSVSFANNVMQLIKAAQILQRDPQFLFLIYGDGPDKKELVDYVKNNCITNVIFKADRIPYRDCAYIVSQSSLNIMNYQPGFGKWGCSTGKLFQYMAAGRPILANIRFNYDLISQYSCGKSEDLETPEQYADAIKTFATMPSDQYDRYCQNAKNAAKNFDYDYLFNLLIKVFEK